VFIFQGKAVQHALAPDAAPLRGAGEAHSVQELKGSKVQEEDAWKKF
jgi:hypothetical protein